MGTTAAASRRVVWQPTEAEASASGMARFLADLQARKVVPPTVHNSRTLHAWSVGNPELFWAEVWSLADVVHEPMSDGRAYHAVLRGGARMAPPDAASGPAWFEGARLNFAEQLLTRRDDGVALVWWTERGRETSVTWRELAAQVARCAAALRAAGVTPGDRVAGWLPNRPEAVIAMLAAASLGAVWSSCSPDFGARGVLDRFGQIAPVVLIVADHYRYNSKRIDVMPRVRDVVAQLPSVRATWVVSGDATRPALDDVPNALHWDHVLAAWPSAGAAPDFVRLPFDHPLYVLYSSGTTGLPKCIVHGAGGTLLQHVKELVLHTDLQRDDVMFYFTTCGWMMWNWLVSSLAIGATVVLYDGAPLPMEEPAILWRMAEVERIAVFGTSARYLAAIEKAGVRPAEHFSLPALRAILSTGSPLAEHSYDYVYDAITTRARLSSISGGTDIVSCFALGDPTEPVYRGALQMLGLGMDVAVYSENGQPLASGAGELVCRAPFPSMPVAFWNDSACARYRAAYFEHFPGVWRHGDWAELTPEGGLVIHGRSDATLNPGGVRIGTAELYRVVEQVPEVLESLVTEQVFGANGGAESRVVLFVRLRADVALSDALKEQLRRRIREEASPHHVPRVIVAVPDIPRTISGKITELAVRDVIHGRPVQNVEALANPESLGFFAGLPELSRWD